MTESEPPTERLTRPVPPLGIQRPAPVAMHPYPNRFERTLRGVREVALIVFLALASAIMVALMAGAAEFADQLSESTPEPTVSECFGEVEC